MTDENRPYYDGSADPYENDDVGTVFGALDATARQQRLSDFFEVAQQLRWVEHFDPVHWAPRKGPLDPEVIGR